MSDLLCVTNRKLVDGDFLRQLKLVAATHPKAIILREKDLSREEYCILAKEVMALCEETGVPCILHSFTEVALELDCPNLHMPLPLLRNLTSDERARFNNLGASVHSVEDALEAQSLGCTYLLAGHVFDTDCKAGLPGRGLDFLRQVVEAVDIPVYGIGGITTENLPQVLETDAAGGAIMSGYMTGSSLI